MSFSQGIVLVSYAAVSSWPIAAYAKDKGSRASVLITGTTGIVLIVLDKLLR